jgi:hypothetical protein
MASEGGIGIAMSMKWREAADLTVKRVAIINQASFSHRRHLRRLAPIP